MVIVGDGALGTVLLDFQMLQEVGYQFANVSHSRIVGQGSVSHNVHCYFLT